MMQNGQAGASTFSGQAFRFIVATIASASVTLALPLLLHEYFALPETHSVAIAFTLAFVLNFFVMRFYVFRSGGGFAWQFVKFAGSNGIFRIGEYLLFLAIFELLGVNYMISVIFSLGVSFCGKFFVQRHFTFRQ